MKRLTCCMSALCLLLAACSGGLDGSTTSTPSRVTKTVTSTSPRPTTTVTVTQQEATPGPVMGYTEAPGQTRTTPMNKVIERCGTKGLHERGTTFFTDGTSGWTEQCAVHMK
ncbi:hypothetical protein CPELA_00085 [Corynebacterium pelargi]|uniref:Secreted protein n=1 Tax=Corynebacterium pelargi TaxID=1471400 RepID=A0A410W5U1_9CORY|nr:hypothetical protein CPELA_00085 [Corynebacterium pelargi]